MQRGDLWWATLPVPRGSEPGFRRPVLIIQADTFNRSQIHTAVVAAITSNLRLADAPGNVHLDQGVGGLLRASVVNVSQILTIDRAFLTEKIGRLPSDVVARIDTGLRLVLSL